MADFYPPKKLYTINDNGKVIELPETLRISPGQTYMGNLVFTGDSLNNAWYASAKYASGFCRCCKAWKPLYIVVLPYRYHTTAELYCEECSDVVVETQRRKMEEVVTS